MKKIFIVLSILCVSLTTFTSCDDNGEGGGSISSGYAPASIPADCYCRFTIE